MGVGMSFGITAETGNNIQTDGLVFYVDAAYKKSYPGSGTTWNDLGPNGSNATLVGGGTFDSANGGSIVFDGTDDVVTATDAGLPSSSNPRSISAWVKNTRVNQWKSIVHYGGSSNNTANFFSIGNTADGYKLHMAAFNNTADGSTDAVPEEEWCNVVMCYGSNAVDYYINGSASGGDASYTGVNTTLAGTLAIGEDMFANAHIDGNIANLIIYDRKLNADEVLQNYNAQKERFGF